MYIRKYFIIPFFILCITFSSSRIFASPSTPLQLTDSERAWLKAHPKITFTWTLDQEPSLMKDENGNYQGLLWDFLQLLNDRSGANIQLETFELKEAIQKIKNREVDGALSLADVNAKNLGLAPTDVYYHGPITIFTRDAIVSEIDGYRSLNNRKVAVYRGSAAVISFLQKNAPEAEIIHAKSNPEAMKLLFEGKVDAYFGFSLYNYLIGKYQLSGVVPAFTDIENPFAFVYGIRPDWPELVSIVNKAIASTTIEERIGILEKWSKMSLGKPEKPAVNLTETEKEWLKAHPSIRLGFNPDMQPLLIQDEGGQLSGILPDIFVQLEAVTGLNIRIEVGPWHEIIKQAGQGEIDGLLSCVPALAKANGLLPTMEYIPTIPVVFGKRGAPFIIKRIDDLKGKRVAYMRAVKFIENILAPIGNKTTAIEVDRFINALTMVLEGKADVALGMNFDTYLLNQSVLTGIEPVFIDTSHVVKTVTAVRPDWPELAGILNQGLAAIGDATINQIIGKWTQIETPVQKIALTDSERAWLAEQPIVRVALDPDWAPVEFMDEKGDYHGISVEYLNRLERLMGIRFEITKGLSWQDAVNGVRNKEQDMFASVARTPGREKFARFTRPYISMPINIFARGDVSYIGNLDVLEGKRVGVVKGYAIHEWLKNNHPKIELVPLPAIPDALNRLVSGDVTAFVGNIVTTSYYIGKLHLNSIRVAGETPYANNQSMAVRDDWPELAGILQKALDAIPQHKRNSIYNSWMSIKYEHAFDYSLLWKIAVGVGLFLVLVLIWSLQIRRQRTALSIARDAADAANRAKSEFLANMSHEIRTPMNAILGFTDILKRQETDPKKSHYVHNIHASGKSLLSLINDILDLSKIEAGKLDLQYSALSVVSFAEDLHMIIEQKIAEKGLDFRFEVDKQLPPALILDEIRLRQVLLNLLGNAVKFTDAGHIRLGVASEWCDAENRSRVNLVFAVVDTGIGISSDAQQKIFNPFEQTKGQKTAEYGGTGLGLAISRRLTEMMGGEISVESQRGIGSTFRVKLPGVEVAAAEALKRGSETEVEADSIHFEQAKILITDDIDYNRELLAVYMEDWPFTIYEAGNGKEAIKQARRHSPDLILLDMKMPVMDGYQAAEKIKQDGRLKAIPIIAVTASTFKRDEAGIDRSWEGYLRKPVSKHDLTEQLARFLPHTRMAEPTGTPFVVPDTARKEITPEDIVALPSGWLEAFSRAVREADTDVCRSLIKELPQTARSISLTLESLIDDYRFGNLIEIIERTKTA